METTKKHSDKSGTITNTIRQPSFDVHDSKFVVNNENLDSCNRILHFDPDTSKVHCSKSNEEKESFTQKSERSIRSYSCVLPSQMEINYMQFIKGNREFRLINDATRAALLDDLCELDKCYYLNISNFEFDVSEVKSELISKVQSDSSFWLYPFVG